MTNSLEHIAHISVLPVADPFSSKEIQTSSYLCADAEFEGSIKCSHGVRIAGKLVGDIHCSAGDVVIESTGSVLGSIHAVGKIFIDGSVGDSLTATESRVTLKTSGEVVLTNNARVFANIDYGTMVFQGRQHWCGSANKIE